MSAVNKSNYDHLYFQMCISTLNIYRIQLPNSILIANFATSYCKTSKCYEVDPQAQCDFYKQLLCLLKVPKSELNDEFYTSTVRLTETAAKSLLKGNHFTQIREYFDYYNLYLMELPTKDKMYLTMGNVFHSAAQCVTELQNVSSSELQKRFESFFKQLKTYCTLYSRCTQQPFVCSILLSFFENLLEYYPKIPKSVWITHMEERLQQLIFKILGILAQVFTKNQVKCKFCKDCDNNTSLFHAITAMGLVGNLMKSSIVNEMKVSISFSNKIIYYLELCCTQIVILKSKRCETWLTAWTETGISIYNIAIKLYGIKHSETAKYFMLLIKNLVKLEGTTSEIFRFDALKTALKCLVDLHSEALDYKRALMFIALMVLLLPNTASSPFKDWVYIKAKERQNEINSSFQELTIACVIEENRAEILSIFPQAQHIPIDQLLIEELNHYKKIWPSRIPMLSVLKKMYEKCDLCTTVKALVTTWNSNALSTHSGVSELLLEIISKFEIEVASTTDLKLENELYLALLYVLKYYSLITEARKNNVKEVEDYLAENVQNSRNKYDIVPSCTNLTLDEYTKVAEYLLEALKFFDKCLSTDTDPQFLQLLKECDVLTVIENIAFEFQLHCDSLHCVKAWFICLNISRVLENADFTLKSIGFLIENSCSDVDAIDAFLNQSENVIETIQLVNTNQAYETLATFYINKSIMFYHNQKFHSGFEWYEKAVCAINKIPVEEQNEILKVRLEMMHVQYLQLPCALNIDNHRTYSLEKFSQVCKRISTYMKERGYVSSYGLAVLFEVNCKLIHMYKWMFLPREVRCYSRDLIVLAQQLAIPLRAAIIVSYLAYSDLQSSRINDCEFKINNLSDMLCLTTNKLCTTKKDEIICDKPRYEGPVIAELTENFADILLDCPVTIKEQALQGSPTFCKTLKLPSILSHAYECKCFYCLSIEYQNLLITVMHLDAEYYVLMDNGTAANYCFNAALQLYDRFTRTSDEFKLKVMKSINCYTFFDVKKMILPSYSATLHGYARHLVRLHDLPKAKQIFKDLINLLSDNIYTNLYLYNEVHLDYAVMLMKGLKLPEAKSNGSENTLIIPEVATDCIKTPESRRSKVIFYRSYSPNPESPPKKIIRKIKCDFSDSKDQKSVKTKKVQSTSLFTAVTPGCSNELIDRVVLEEGFNKNSNDTVVVPLSPNAYTPQAIQASTGLRSRTKILTSKLKSETTKKKMTKNEMNDSKSSVCKNLISELCATDKKFVKKKDQKSSIENVGQTKRVTRALAKNRM
ncbi:hypothetical protein FQR65_LT08564 [Abscondita terminalis]|nr:hypothetical protein FQR65_LT08564 [Abscondita terminalis]